MHSAFSHEPPHAFLVTRVPVCLSMAPTLSHDVLKGTRVTDSAQLHATDLLGKGGGPSES